MFSICTTFITPESLESMAFLCNLSKKGREGSTNKPPLGGPKWLLAPSQGLGSVKDQSCTDNLPLDKGKLWFENGSVSALLTLRNSESLRLLQFEMNASYFSHTDWNVQVALLPVLGESIWALEETAWVNFQERKTGMMTYYQNNLTGIWVNIFLSKMVENSWNICPNNRTGYWQSGLP